MSNMELVLNMLAEATTKEISTVEEPNSFNQNEKIKKKGGKITGNSRKNRKTHKNFSDNFRK